MLATEAEDAESGPVHHAIIVFADMRGFTRMADNVEFHPVAASFVTSFLKIIDSRLGFASIRKALGDGAMAIIPVEPAEAIDRLDGILGALAAADGDFALLVHDHSRVLGISMPLRLGWGVARGTVFPINESDVIGGAVNRAARLCDCARPSGVVIDAANFPDRPGLDVDGDWHPALRALPGLGEVQVWESESPFSEFQMREKRREAPEVHVAGICLKDDRLLIARRSDCRSLFPGRWEGCGGQLRRGETFAEGVARHFRSEMGLTVSPVADRYKIYTIRHSDNPVIPGIRFLCRHVEGSPQSKNHSETRWVTLAETLAMPEDDFPDGFQADVRDLMAQP